MSLSRFGLLGQFAGAASTLAFIRTDARIMQQCYDFTISANYICTIFLLRDWSCTQLRVERVGIWAVGRFEDLLAQVPLIHDLKQTYLLPSYKDGGPIGTRGSFIVAASPLAEGSGVLGPGPVGAAPGLWVA